MDSDGKKRHKRDRSRSHKRSKRSRSRSGGSPDGGAGFSKSKPKKSGGGFSNFSDRPPEELKQKPSTQEILDYYKQFNPNQGLTNHNKAERQLYIGNIPPGLDVPQLMELLNTALKEIGKDSGLFQDGDPIVGSWISGDGHYAFVDFRTPEEATQGFVLSQVSIHGNNLKVGRPKNATGPIPNPTALLAGNPSKLHKLTLNYIDQNQNQNKSNKSKLMPGQFKLGQGMEPLNQVITSMNTKLLVSNFPNTHTKDMILQICEVFGKVKNVDQLKDTSTGEFRGQVHVEYDNELDAKKGATGMMGLKVGENLLFVKRLTTISAPTTSLEGEVFKSLIEDKPTPCLCLKNVVKPEEIDARDDYKELEGSIEEEMSRYGNCLKVHCPRPPLFGDPYSVPGYGKVYVRFETEDEAEKAKHSIYKRRFNGRCVEAIYYPMEKFIKSVYD